MLHVLSFELVGVISSIGKKLIGLVWLLLFQFSFHNICLFRVRNESFFYDGNGVQCFEIIYLKHKDKIMSLLMLEMKDLRQQELLE